MNILIRTKPGNRCQGIVTFAGRNFPCALGRGGMVWNKREGDGATPIGVHQLLRIFYRADRVSAPLCPFPVKQITSNMGWCDAVNDPNYNRLITQPFLNSHEVMMRYDHLYDICVELSYNARSTIKHRGSAIFFHISRPGFTPTEGCVAVTRSCMQWILGQCIRTTRMVIRHC